MFQCTGKEKEGTFARRRTKASNLAEILATSLSRRDCGALRRSFNDGHYCAGASINCIRASPLALYIFYIHTYTYAQRREREKKRERFLCRGARVNPLGKIIHSRLCPFDIARREICGCIDNLPNLLVLNSDLSMRALTTLIITKWNTFYAILKKIFKRNRMSLEGKFKLYKIFKL